MTIREQTQMKEITINGEVYIKKSEHEPLALSEYVIVRTYSAGVFAGFIESREQDTVVMRNARRLWFWSGAASLSQLAQEGVKNPDECKFPCEVDRVELMGVIEILNVTEKAKQIIKEVPVWEK